ncbi:MAG: 50S ribosomal protein L32e [Candidatus Bathyarchaeota archaeon]|nr:50S ribosomal protein L32e [Candidatus Bathyarchaeota archaeon]MDH5790979.1 50S ribosomal protein L32e [Candidatus Bathyarchaeota archaeon]
MSDTADRERLMSLKKRMAKKRPKFERPESWRYVRISKNWRKPKGIDNKTRQKRRGWPASPNVGYGSPKAVRDLHPSGMEEVAVFNVGDLAIIDPETQVARIGGSVGARKRSRIVEEAQKREIRVLNPSRSQPTEPEEGEEEAEEPEEELEEEVEPEEKDEPEVEEGEEAER